MPFHRTTKFAAMLVFAVCLFMGAATRAQEAKAEEIDASTKPGDDFYRYANGGWLRKVAIPAGQTSRDTRAIVAETTGARVRDLIREAAAAHSIKGSVVQKVGDYYPSFLDEEAIETKGLTPLAGEMERISVITNKTSLSAYLGTTLNGESDGLTENADHIFGLWINQDFEDADHNVVHLVQGGLGMSNRDNYVDPSPNMAELRERYKAHIAGVLKLAGVLEWKSKAKNILALETRMAQAFAPESDAADVFKQDNPWKRTEFAVKAPGLDWDAYFEAAGLARQTDFIVWQPSAVSGVAALVASESTEDWKDYLRFHLMEHFTSVLPKTVGGELRIVDCEKGAIATTNAALGQAVGQIYTQRYFPPEAKVKAKVMADNSVRAYRTRISTLAWMLPETKKKALAKLDALEVMVGYPDTWIDYAALEAERGDALGNMRRAEAFHPSRNLSKLRQPVEPIEWPINPQIPGAVIMFSPNAEFFTAGILQPPYFDSDGDSASNYGSAGAAMAHEIGHSFDELGNIYDAHGRLGNWWTAQDREQYHAVAEKLVVQFNRYCPFSELCVNGKQVLTENSADLAGLLVAHDAYILSLKGQSDIVAGGVTGEQRFFLAFAQRWRKLQSEEALHSQIRTDIHSPGEYRSDTVRNVDDWYKAYKIVPGDKLYIEPEDRVRIW